jgi:DNA-binding LacI/PurR family transcriptional regulator
MNFFRVFTASEQLRDYLRTELIAGRWQKKMPGAGRLEKELGVGRNTVEAALEQLERDGLLQNLGSRRGRRIQIATNSKNPKLGIAVLLYEQIDRHSHYMAELELALVKAGHSLHFQSKSLTEMGMSVKLVKNLVSQTRADAWLVVAGSRDVLQWFSEQPLPAFALFGRRTGLPMAAAGPDNITSLTAVTHSLIDMGHSRIVTICRKERRLPTLGTAERAFLEVLESHGIHAGPYNLPDWIETKEGLQALLQSLFRVSQPTALIFDEASILTAILQFLGTRSIKIPEDITLICTSFDPAFSLCMPPIAHTKSDYLTIIRSVIRWANHVAAGKDYRIQTLTPVRFIPGGTIGPAKGKSFM